MDGRRQLQLLEQAFEPPEADPHAVFVPAPVRMIGLLRLALGRRDDHAGHRTRDVPVLERKHRPHHQPDTVRKLQGAALLDAGKWQAVERQHGSMR
jgi:hypothetical protein